MSDSYLGLIKNTRAGRGIASYDVFVFRDRMVIVRSGLNPMFLKVITAAFGLLGYFLGKRWLAKRNRQQEQRTSLNAEQLASLHPGNMLVLTSRLVEGRLKKILFGSELALAFVDGTDLTFVWSSTDNNHEVVKGLLRQAFGSKLVDARSAA